jgi:hypothetical protein
MIHVIGMDESAQTIQSVVPDGHGGIRSGLRLAQQPRRRLNIAKLAGRLGQGPPDWAFEPSRRVTAILILPGPTEQADVSGVEGPLDTFDDFVLHFVSVPDRDQPVDPLHPDRFALFEIGERPGGPQMQLWD